MAWVSLSAAGCVIARDHDWVEILWIQSDDTHGFAQSSLSQVNDLILSYIIFIILSSPWRTPAVTLVGYVSLALLILLIPLKEHSGQKKIGEDGVAWLGLGCGL